MRTWRNRLGNWFFQLENEILLPFLAVGIIVLGGFGVISFYNGYTIEKRGLESTARQVFSVMNQDRSSTRTAETLSQTASASARCRFRPTDSLSS